MTWARASAVSANIRIGWMPRGRRKPTTPLATRPKNGSAKTWLWKGFSPLSSPAPETTRAIAPVRRVTRERAARLGT